MHRGIWLVGWLVLFTPFTFGQAGGKVPPIVSVKNVKPNDSVFKATNEMWSKPIVIRSEKEAAENFAKEALEALNKQVDFKQQFVLVFAWKGSGEDRLEYAVAESFPEQVFFSRKPGKTKDNKEHIHLYALRSNVKWRTSAKNQPQDEKGKEDKVVRPLKFTPANPRINFSIGGQNKLVTLPDAAAVEKLVGKDSAKSLVELVDFKKETIVLVSWTTSGPPEGVLKFEMKGQGEARMVQFYIQGPPGGGVRGQRARIGADFFAVPSNLKVSFDPKER